MAQKAKPPASPPTPRGGERNYCRVLNPHRYARNAGCRAHDNAYGVKGGGGARERRAADRALLAHMRAQGDPMAWLAYLATRCWGWIFFHYHPGRGLWRGQLSQRLKLFRHPPAKD